MSARTLPSSPIGSSPLGDPGRPPPTLGPVSLIEDINYERKAAKRGPFPRGATGFSIRRTHGFRHDPLAELLKLYTRYGPVFSARILHGRQVFMLGPEANHFVLVSGRENFEWRHGRFGDLYTLLGNGLLTTDDGFHDRSREIMMPSFHKRRIEWAVEVMAEEADRAVAALPVGEPVDIYHWARNLAMRVAMRALFGFDPDGNEADRVADLFEQGLSFHEREFVLQVLVGPGTPHAKLVRARRELEARIGSEIRRRRQVGETGGLDVLSSLLEATDEDGNQLSDMEVLDHVMTLMFAGHDTTTSTVTFLTYELCGSPRWSRILREEADSVLGDGQPSPEQLFGDLPLLGQAIDETLRLYPPAWIGPRRAVADFEFEGTFVPKFAPVAYSSWASHRLPDVFPDAHSFLPERFEKDERAKWPRGAYVPFGGGPRVCIGRKFGYTEVHAIAQALLRRFEFRIAPGYEMLVRQMPTLSPKHGLPVILSPR